MCSQIDLHIHTVFSDGSLSPQQIVDLAILKDFSHIAITDHDTYAGVSDAINYSKEKNGPEIIPAVEFSSHYDGDEIHILAYFIPLDNIIFNDLISKVTEYSLIRLRKIVEVISSLGFHIDYDELLSLNENITILAPQIMKYLEFKGYISSEQEGFNFFRNYLIEKSPQFVYHENHPSEIIEMCKAAGTVTSFAHPHKLKNFENLEPIIEMGVDAVEYYYPNVDDDKKSAIDNFASEYNLLKTGGSDFHGIYSITYLGDGLVPFEVIGKLKELRDIRQR